MKNNSPVDALLTQINHDRALKASVNAEELEGALKTLRDALKHHWSTGGGRRLKAFMWSLWNDEHLVNLYDLCSGLDTELGEAVVIIFRAQMFGVLKEAQKKRVLEESGEFARWNAAAKNVPDDETLLYPWPPINIDQARAFIRRVDQDKQKSR